MKLALTVIGSIFLIGTYAQKIETYYDHNWKPCKSEDARFYSIKQKTDSGWLRKDYFVSGLKLQMQALYSDSACKIMNGYGYYYYPSGMPEIVGRKVNGKNEGICMSFHPNGMMRDSGNYKNGLVIGYKLGWHSNGYTADSINTINDSMQTKVSWFDNGSLSAAGYTKHNKKYGKWKYYHKNGNIASEEVFYDDILQRIVQYKEDGSLQKDTSTLEIEASFKGGRNGWKKYLEDKLYWPYGYTFTKGTKAVVNINLTINEEGKPIDVYVKTPFHKAFDEIALKTLMDSKNWNPAIQNNRKVSYRFSQAITFAME
jgi:antitoxin component YwqK of YwqJK toxin-antitoxin module